MEIIKIIEYLKQIQEQLGDETIVLFNGIKTEDLEDVISVNPIVGMINIGKLY